MSLKSNIAAFFLVLLNVIVLGQASNTSPDVWHVFTKQDTRIEYYSYNDIRYYKLRTQATLGEDLLVSVSLPILTDDYYIAQCSEYIYKGLLSSSVIMLYKTYKVTILFSSLKDYERSMLNTAYFDAIRNSDRGTESYTKAVAGLCQAGGFSSVNIEKKSSYDVYLRLNSKSNVFSPSELWNIAFITISVSENDSILTSKLYRIDNQ